MGEPCRVVRLGVTCLFGVILLVNVRHGDGRNLRNHFTGRNGICLEPQCVISSATILKTLNTKIDPCEDFYQYSCGGWLQDHDEGDYTRFAEVKQQISRIIRKVLEEESDDSNDTNSDAVRKAKDFYHACMNMTRVEAAGGDPLKQVIKLLGGWGFLNDVDLETNTPSDYLAKHVDITVLSDNVLDTLVASHKLSSVPLFDMWVTVDDKNSSSHIIEFAQEGLQLISPEFYEDKDLIEAYIELGAFTAFLLKFEVDFDPNGNKEVEYYKYALEKMANIVAFENELAKAFVSDEDLYDPVDTYHKMTVAQFAASIPALDISSFLNLMFNTTIADNKDILVYTPQYFVRLNDILQKTTESIIKDYIVWHTISPMLSYLSSDYRHVLSEFHNELYGEREGAAPWEVCVSRTQTAMGEVTGALFVQERIPHDTKNKVEEMLQSIRQTFIDSLPTLDWMEESTKSKALDKARAVNSKVGWPDWMLDLHQLDEHLKEVKVDPHDSFLNMIWKRLHIMEGNLALLGKPVDKTLFDMSADTVNAYYNPSSNEIVFPAGILQSPFFSPDNPMAYNYGSLGPVIGHELTHGFDNSGRQYDEFGNLNDWWDDKSEYQYEQRAECLEAQYDNYTVLEGVNVDGLQTLGENIADNGGIRTAFKAFQSWLKTKPGQTEPKYAGLQGFTPEQLFFIGTAQVWCQRITEESAYISALTNPHAPNQFRVKGMMSNMQEFADVFQCPKGSPMNPMNKFKVW